MFSVFHWRAQEPVGNFGDALTVLYAAHMLDGASLFQMGTIHLVGSVISRDRLRVCRRDGYVPGDGLGRPVFWGCGTKNGDPLPPNFLRSAIFLGVRGTLTRDALDLPRDTPLGDTALLLPRFYAPKPHAATVGKVLYVPHVHHPDLIEADLVDSPDAVVLSPAVPNTVEACESFIDAIASARFVMANAMHAAVVALAYGVPFCFWGGRYINHPFKWADFARGVGFDMPFAGSFAEAMRLYDAVRPDRAFAAWDPVPLMEVAPYRLKPML